MLKKCLVASAVFFAIFVIAHPSFAVTQEAYPQIEIGGYKRWLYRQVDISPAKNYFLAIGSQEVLGGSGPWAEELNLLIDAELLKDVGLHYGLKQIPNGFDFPDVRLNYQNYSLYYGYPQNIFSGQELLLQDYPSGVGVGATRENRRIYFFYSKYPDARINDDYHRNVQFRDPKYTGDLSGSQFYVDNPYHEFLSINLDRSDIDPDSIKVASDGAKLFQGTDYYFDEAYGLLLIARRYEGAKEIKLNYSLKGGTPQARSINLAGEGWRQAFQASDMRLVEGTEIVTVDKVRQIRDIDYRINYQTGLLIMNNPLSEAAEVSIDFDYTAGQDLRATETISGQAGTTFVLAHRKIIDNSESVIKNGSRLASGSEYSINEINGVITFSAALTAADTVEVAYSYAGIRYDVLGLTTEDKLSDWSVWGISVMSATPNQTDDAIFDQIRPSSYVINNIYYRTTINQDTFINAELAISGFADYPSKTTEESDSAVKVFGKTRIGPVEMNATYNKTGLNFASVHKTKLNSPWRDEMTRLNVKYIISENFILKIGAEKGINQETAASSPETEVSGTTLGLSYRPFDFIDFNYDVRFESRITEGMSGSRRSQYLYSGLDLIRLLPWIKTINNRLSIYYKNYYGRQLGPEYGQMVFTTVDKTDKYSRVGCLAQFVGGITGYIQYKDEDQANLLDNTSLSTKTPYYKISYDWAFGGGHHLLFFADYADARQTGSTNYTKRDTSSGINWELPVENPILASFSVGTTLKNTDYNDLDNGANNYKASEMAFQATMAF
jgi:hypothetical protein